jgi:hypothetical protein
MSDLLTFKVDFTKSNDGTGARSFGGGFHYIPCLVSVRLCICEVGELQWQRGHS